MLLTLIVALGLIAWEAARDAPRHSAMGSVGDADGGSMPTPVMVLPAVPKTKADMRTFVAETCALEDPEEMAERAKSLRKTHPETAQAIMQRARTRMKQIGDLNASPFPGVSDYRWTKFVQLVATGKPKVSASNHVGLFMFAWPRLVELDAAANLRKDDNGRYLADMTLKPEMTVEDFAKHPLAQYRVFEASMKQYNTRLNPFRRYIGQTAEGKTVTWSGLLGIAHRAGIQALSSWLQNPDERKRFPNTTATFLKTTGVF